MYSFNVAVGGATRWAVVKLAFHDTDIDILARIVVARMSASVSASWNASLTTGQTDRRTDRRTAELFSGMLHARSRMPHASLGCSMFVYSCAEQTLNVFMAKSIRRSVRPPRPSRLVVTGSACSYIT